MDPWSALSETTQPDLVRLRHRSGVVVVAVVAISCVLTIAGVHTHHGVPLRRSVLVGMMSAAGVEDAPDREALVLEIGLQRTLSGFLPVGGGLDRACLGSGSATSSSYVIYKGVTSLNSCAALCSKDPQCLGIEFQIDYSECKVWASHIAGATELEGGQCWRREFPGFELVNGGSDQSCEFAKGDGRVALSRDGTKSLYECQAHCIRASGACLALQFDSAAGSCLLWTTPVESTFTTPGVLCLRYHDPAFEPVEGGPDQICAQREQDERKETRFPPQGDEVTLGQCQARCKRMAACSGIEHYDGRCRLFTEPITSSGGTTPGAVCLQHRPRLFVDEGKDVGCSCSDTESAALDGNFSLFECQVACARTGFCHGIEFHDDEQRCELWMNPISSSVPREGSRCQRREDSLLYPAANSLFCFALMLPWTDEPVLLSKQLEKRWGIFACDASMIYSNPIQEIGGIRTGLIDMDLHCEKGGPPGMEPTVLNTPIFKKVWQTVIEDAHFRAHDWTVKVDPDTVFIAQRVRQIVQHIPKDIESESGVFLKNCKLGLHGPIEVVSRRALEVFSGNTKGCEEPGQEDVFLEKCLVSLGVHEHMQDNLLAEGECQRGDWIATPDWFFCNSSHAAFHPLKTVEKYEECINNVESP